MEAEMRFLRGVKGKTKREKINGFEARLKNK
jgi:hypothetical protein